jgi:hypothetical protein
MSVQGVGGSYSVSYVKAEQNCGLQSCLTRLCCLIIRFVCCFFKTFCSCCCEDNSARRVVDLTAIRTQLPRLGEQVFPRELLLSIFCYDGMGTPLKLLLVSKSWYGMVHHAYQELLKNKKCLTLQEIFLCERILGRFRNDWNSVFIHCEQLEALNFSHALEKQKDNITHISSIIHVALKKCPHFHILDLSYCRGIAGFIGIEKREKLTHLNLAFSCDQYFADDITVAWVCCFPNLVSLDLTGLTTCNEHIAQIASSCPHLCRLKISSIGSDENWTLPLLLKGCPSLTHLSIGSLGITQITSIGAHALALYGKNLKVFHYYYAPLFDNIEFSFFKERICTEALRPLKEKLPDAELAFTHDLHEEASLAHDFFLAPK